jgi:hypothetical protein
MVSLLGKDRRGKGVDRNTTAGKIRLWALVRLLSLRIHQVPGRACGDGHPSGGNGDALDLMPVKHEPMLSLASLR